MATSHRRFRSFSDTLSKNPRSIGKMFRRRSKSSLKEEEGAVTLAPPVTSEPSPSSRTKSPKKTRSGKSKGRHKKRSLAGSSNSSASDLLGENSRRIVVAIDFGTTYSGYAYAYRRKPDEIHLMRRNEAGQVGGPSHKIPTILLMDEREQFHAFGYDARDAYHDMTEEESQKWLYFEKFKMELHSRKVSSY